MVDSRQSSQVGSASIKPLDAEQRLTFLARRNAVATRRPRPETQFLALIPESLRPASLKAFHPAQTLEQRFWMGAGDSQDIHDWGQLIREVLEDVISRARTIDPHRLPLGKGIDW